MVHVGTAVACAYLCFVVRHNHDILVPHDTPFVLNEEVGWCPFSFLRSECFELGVVVHY